MKNISEYVNNEILKESYIYNKPKGYTSDDDKYIKMAEEYLDYKFNESDGTRDRFDQPLKKGDFIFNCYTGTLGIYLNCNGKNIDFVEISGNHAAWASLWNQDLYKSFRTHNI